MNLELPGIGLLWLWSRGSELFLLTDFINEKFLNIWSVLSFSRETFGVEASWFDPVSLIVYRKSVFSRIFFYIDPLFNLISSLFSAFFSLTFLINLYFTFFISLERIVIFLF
jgi:hypothetical protein